LPTSPLAGDGVSNIVPALMQLGRGAEVVESAGEETRTGAATTVDAPLPGVDGCVPAPLQRRDRSRYDIVAEHGRGGLGRVFRAHDKELGREIAIKELLSRTNVAEVRFFREALITARLEHPGIVPVHEAGRWPDGTPFYAMKLVSGEPLSEIVDRCATSDERRALIPKLAAVAEAIAYAHQQRIVHRDLKPANVIVGKFGETVVIDWGLAKDLADDSGDGLSEGPFRTSDRPELTAVGSVLGTPAYMAPEQARGEPVDERADVYALGAMLREIMGAAPRRTKDARPIEGAFDDADLAAIVGRATAKRREERYASAGPLAADLAAYLGGRRISARRYSAVATVRHWIAHHRAISAAIAIAAVVVAVVSAVAIARVVHARDRAERALAEATTERERAIVAQARVLLPRDPTAAARLLDEHRLATRDPLLAARIRANGVAPRSLEIDHMRFPNMTPLGIPGRIAAVTELGALHVFDVATGEVLDVDHGLTNPVQLITRGDEIVYVTRRNGGFTLAIARADGTTRDVAPLDELPQDLVYDGVAAYALDLRGTVTRVDARSGARSELDHGVGTFVVAGDVLYLCRRDGSLMRHRGSLVERSAEPCTDKAQTLSTGDAAIIPSDDHGILVVDGPRARRVAFDIGIATPRYEIAPSGLAVGVDPDGNGLFLPAGAASFEHVRFASDRPTDLAASGSLAGWGFRDGTIIVHDTASHEVWTLKAHDSQIAYLFLDATTMTAVTCAGREIRIWSLGRGVARRVATTTDVVFNAIPSPSGTDVLLDSRSGEASVLTVDGLVPLHRHAQPAFGAAWCGERACTSSWDGTVLCSDPDTRTIVTRRETAAAVRWIDRADGDCVYTSADGTVGSVTSGEIFRTSEDPRRVRVSTDAHLVAASDNGGNVVVYDLAARREIARRRLHDGPVAGTAWVGDDLLTIGWDGALRRWSSVLEPRWSLALDGMLTAFAVGRDRIVAVSDTGTIYVVSTGGQEIARLELGLPVTAVAGSPSGARVALIDEEGELLVIGLDDLGIEVRRVDRGPLTCVSFVTETDVLGCSYSGGLFRIHLQQTQEERDR